MSRLKSIIDTVQRFIAKNRVIVFFLIKIKNQINKIIAYSLIQDHIFKNSGEALLIKKLSPFLTTCIDVGANIGEWTDMVLSYSDEHIQKIIIIEPGKKAFDQLFSKFSKDKRLLILNKGLGHVNSHLFFNEQSNAGEMSSFVPSSNNNNTQTLIEVITLDEFLKDQDFVCIDFLKIDCEGFDFNVLKGAEESLRNRKIGIIQFEYNAEWIDAGATLKSAYLLLTQNKYQFYVLKKNGLSSFDPNFYGEFFGYSNFVAISEKWNDKIETLIVK